MAYKYRITYAAEDDLEGILDYIANKLCNVTAAREFYAQFVDSIKIVCDFPQSGMLLDNSIIKEDSIRKVFVGQYIAYYKFVDKEIIVLRVVYGKSALDEIIKKL